MTRPEKYVDKIINSIYTDLFITYERSEIEKLSKALEYLNKTRYMPFDNSVYKTPAVQIVFEGCWDGGYLENPSGFSSGVLYF